MTQTLARTTTVLDGRKTVKMTGPVYLRAILPIGFLFNMFLVVFGNLAYLYLSVPFIQMLKATTPVAVLLVSWTSGTTKLNIGMLFNVSFIVLGAIIATFGENAFILTGFFFQCAGIVFEAVRLVLVQKLFSREEYKMDPLVLLYYSAPTCALMNSVIAISVEVPHISVQEVYAIGAPTFVANALVAFLLNASAAILISRTSSLVITLCGILKDVILIGVSMTLWQTLIPQMQFFRYAISLTSIVYYNYNLGPEPIKAAAKRCLTFTTTATAARTNHSISKSLLAVLAPMAAIIVLLGILLPRFAPDYGPRSFLLLGTASVGLVTGFRDK